jgi:hypothetical protein
MSRELVRAAGSSRDRKDSWFLNYDKIVDYEDQNGHEFSIVPLLPCELGERLSLEDIHRRNDRSFNNVQSSCTELRTWNWRYNTLMTRRLQGFARRFLRWWLKWKSHNPNRAHSNQMTREMPIWVFPFPQYELKTLAALVFAEAEFCRDNRVRCLMTGESEIDWTNFCGGDTHFAANKEGEPGGELFISKKILDDISRVDEGPSTAPVLDNLPQNIRFSDIKERLPKRLRTRLESPDEDP